MVVLSTFPSSPLPLEFRAFISEGSEVDNIFYFVLAASYRAAVNESEEGPDNFGEHYDLTSLELNCRSSDWFDMEKLVSKLKVITNS